MPSSFVPSDAISLPSTVPDTVILPVTSIPTPTSRFPAISTVPSVSITNLADPTALAVPDVPKTILSPPLAPIVKSPACEPDI